MAILAVAVDCIVLCADIAFFGQGTNCLFKSLLLSVSKLLLLAHRVVIGGIVSALNHCRGVAFLETLASTFNFNFLVSLLFVCYVSRRLLNFFVRSRFVVAYLTFRTFVSHREFVRAWVVIV